MKRILSAVSLFTIMMASWTMAAPNDPVVPEDLGNQVKLSNGKVSFVVGKADATIRTMTLGNSANLAGRGAYFAVANSGGHDGWDVHNGVFKIERNTPDLVEISIGAQIGGVYFTQYYVLKRGDQGFYVSVLMQRRPGDPPERTGQIRWSFYLNNRFNYQLVNDKEQGPIPNMQGAVRVQDATYRLPDGSVYTKYNYCDYIENTGSTGCARAVREVTGHSSSRRAPSSCSRPINRKSPSMLVQSYIGFSHPAILSRGTWRVRPFPKAGANFAGHGWSI